MKNELIKKILKAFKEYCEDEFGEYEAPKGNILDIMYTEVSDWDVQVSYNLDTQKLITTISNDTEEYTYQETHSLEDMLEDMKTGDFAGWYSYAHDIYDEKFLLANLDW